MAKPFKERIPKPDDFVPESHFPDDWKRKAYRGKPRCPAWSKQSGAQCQQVAGHRVKDKHGDSRGGEVGLCCAIHGGGSKGSPKGRPNNVQPDLRNSKFIRVEDLPMLESFAAMTPKDRADLLANIMMLRAAKTLEAEKKESEENEGTATEKQPIYDARLIELARAADRSLRTVASFLQMEQGKPPGGDGDDDSGTNESRTETAFELFEQLAEDGDGEEDS